MPLSSTLEPFSPAGRTPGTCVARVGDLWYAHHLLSIGDHLRFGLSWSLSLATWRVDLRPLGYEPQPAHRHDPRPSVEWNTTSIVPWQGWWVGMLSNFTFPFFGTNSR